jgi:hypothetical protein
MVDSQWVTEFRFEAQLAKQYHQLPASLLIVTEVSAGRVDYTALKCQRDGHVRIILLPDAGVLILERRVYAVCRLTPLERTLVLRGLRALALVEVVQRPALAAVFG